MQTETLTIRFDDPNTIDYKLSLPRDKVPPSLAVVGVQLEEWEVIWNSVNQWAPHLQKSYVIDAHAVQNLQNYQTQTYLSEAVWGEWGDNGVEKKVSKQIITSAHALAGLSLKENNSLAAATFILNRRGIMVQLQTNNERYFEQWDGLFGQRAYFEEADFLKPVGLVFLIPLYQDEHDDVESMASIPRASEKTKTPTASTPAAAVGQPQKTRKRPIVAATPPLFTTPVQPKQQGKPKKCTNEKTISEQPTLYRSPLDPNSIYDTTPRNRRAPDTIRPEESWKNI